MVKHSCIHLVVHLSIYCKTHLYNLYKLLFLSECFLLPEAGLCLGYFPRYYFNIDTGLCEEFIYGGCQGNENNFHTMAECHAHCS